MRNRNLIIVGLVAGIVYMTGAMLIFSHQPAEASNSISPASLVKPVDLKLEPSLRFQRFETEKGDHYARFQLSNPTAQTIYFYGYGPELPQQFYERRSEDEWVYAGSHWCGTGMKLHQLDAGKTIDFSVCLTEDSWFLEPTNQSLFDHGEPIRVGTRYSFVKNRIKTWLWSETVDVSRLGNP